MLPATRGGGGGPVRLDARRRISIVILRKTRVNVGFTLRLKAPRVVIIERRTDRGARHRLEGGNLRRLRRNGRLQRLDVRHEGGEIRALGHGRGRPPTKTAETDDEDEYATHTNLLYGVLSTITRVQREHCGIKSTVRGYLEITNTAHHVCSILIHPTVPPCLLCTDSVPGPIDVGPHGLPAQ